MSSTEALAVLDQSLDLRERLQAILNEIDALASGADIDVARTLCETLLEDVDEALSPSGDRQPR